MPLYEYECDACGHRFEQIQKFSDPPVERCPVCGGRVRKLQSAPAFQFKGSGWYITDYAKKKDGDAAPVKSEGKTDTSSEARADTKPETKAETKTETKPESKPANKST